MCDGDWLFADTEVTRFDHTVMAIVDILELDGVEKYRKDA